MPTPSSIAARPSILLALLGALALVLAVVFFAYAVHAQGQEVTTQTTLVSNTGQSHSATAAITEQYAMGFRLGTHGQGYEISGISIDLAEAPSDLTVSLWIGSHPGHSQGRGVQRKLFDFTNPASFKVGLNRFAAPAGAFAFPNINYYIVLSGFDTSLSIKETTSDAEDPGGETGAILFNDARVRALGSTGRWATSTSLSSVLRLAVEGSRGDYGILASSFAQPWLGDQEIISIGDDCCFDIRVGSADRYLIRGLALVADDTLARGGFFGLPFDVKKGSDQLFSLTYTSAQGDLVDGPLALTSPAGINEWAAPQGATVAGGSSTTYSLKMDIKSIEGDTEHVTRGGVTLGRIFGRSAGAHDAQYYDTPTSPRVTFTDRGDVALEIPHMAVLGEPLHAMVQNLGQSDNGYGSVDSTTSVISQGFTTGSDPIGRLPGIGVNIEGSNNEVPDGPESVSVAVHADASGLPGDKLFDLVSPTEYGAGHHFFEAPAGATLELNTSYVMVWSHLGGTAHRLQRTTSNNEDSGKLTGSGIADAYFRGADLQNLSVDSSGNSLEIAVYTRVINVPATGRPIVTPLEELVGFLQADLSDIVDANGLPGLSAYSYEWFRVDGATGAETNIGVNLRSYQVANADIGHRIKVRVSFLDKAGAREALTSEPFGPIGRRHLRSPRITLVGNTDRSPSATAMITKQYALGFRLGRHGQGYEISGVSIDLAAAPSDLTVSLWIGSHPGHSQGTGVQRKLFDFTNPASFQVGLNEFAAPAGAFAYPNINYYIVLSGFDTSLSITETTSDAEDAGAEPGAVLFDEARVRALGSTGRWASSTSRASVLRLAVKGARRDYGILASSFAQSGGQQEIISQGDECCFDIRVGSADRYLIRGLALVADDSTPQNGFYGLPLTVTKGSDKLFRLTYASARGDLVDGPESLTSPPGINEWTAPQGATVAGGSSTTYSLKMSILSIQGDTPDVTRGGVVLGRIHGRSDVDPPDLVDTYAHDAQYYDAPKPPGVTFTDRGDVALEIPFMAVLGEPLDAMVSNFGQTDNSYVSLGGANAQVASQGFATGSDSFGYRLQGISVNIEGSDNSFPSRSSSVSVAVHADSNGQPGGKLFDLISPSEYGAGHNFFEAPPGAVLAPDTSYVLVWRYVDGRYHRLRRTSSDSEDSGALTGFSIANAFYLGADLESLSEDSGSNALEIAVYGGPSIRQIVQNLDQTDSGYLSLGGANAQVASQGFTTGSDEFGYRLQGIGVNIEGSEDRFPDGPSSVSVAVYSDSNGKPGAKRFDLVSPTEFGAGRSFFEAPPGTNLGPNTSYVLVWRFNSGTWHRLQLTSSDDEDSGALPGTSIADAFYLGADLISLSEDSNSNALEIAVYGEVNRETPFVPGGHPVGRRWLHIPEGVEVGDQFRLLFVTHHGTTATSGSIDDYNDLVLFEAAGRSKRYPEVDDITHPVIRSVASDFRAVVCTEADDARDNTGMTDAIGVPVHWLDGGWEDRPTLIANSYDQFYGGQWMNHNMGAYVTGNSMHFDDNEAIWTGCLSSGVKHPDYPMGATHMVIVGTPRDEDLHPLGTVNVDSDYLATPHFVEFDALEPRPVYKGIYAISPIFTVVR